MIILLLQYSQMMKEYLFYIITPIAFLFILLISTDVIRKIAKKKLISERDTIFTQVKKLVKTNREYKWFYWNLKIFEGRLRDEDSSYYEKDFETQQQEYEEYCTQRKLLLEHYIILIEEIEKLQIKFFQLSNNKSLIAVNKRKDFGAGEYYAQIIIRTLDKNQLYSELINSTILKEFKILRGKFHKKRIELSEIRTPEYTSYLKNMDELRDVFFTNKAGLKCYQILLKNGLISEEEYYHIAFDYCIETFRLNKRYIGKENKSLTPLPIKKYFILH